VFDNHGANPFVLGNLPYDTEKDFDPVLFVGTAPYVISTHPQKPYKTLADVVAAAKAKPKSIRYATFGSGSGPHLSGELFALAAGIQLQDIPYKGSSQSSLAVIGGEVEIAIDTVAAVAPHVRAGKLRALGIVGATRSSMLPEVRTLAEQGLPEATFDAWYGFAAPARTPAPVIDKLARTVVATMGHPALQAQLRAQGMEPVAIGAAAFRAQMEGEISRYRALAHRAGIMAE